MEAKASKHASKCEHACAAWGGRKTDFRTAMSSGVPKAPPHLIFAARLLTLPSRR
jgi:hypothetical protein